MQQLVVKFGASADAPVPWLRFDKTENEIIASGELSSIEELSNIKVQADNAEVIALISAADALGTQINLPEKYNRKLLTATQYMLEEKLAFDADTQFIAKGTIDDNILPVVVIDKARLAYYRDALKQAGIFCQKMFVDGLLLPTPKDTELSIVEIAGELLVKSDRFHAIAGSNDWIFTFLKQNPQQITAYSELSDPVPDEFTVEYNYEQLPLDLLRTNINEKSINLLQGEFAIKDKTHPVWDKWRVAAVLAIIALCVDIGFKSFQLSQLKQQREQLDARIVTLVKDAFPSISRVRKATLKRTISQAMNRLETTGGSASFLVMLSQMSDAFKSTGVTPQTLIFNAERAELRMQSVAQNFESLERFKRELTELGLTVEQGAMNNRGDEFVGTVVIKG